MYTHSKVHLQHIIRLIYSCSSQFLLYFSYVAHWPLFFAETDSRGGACASPQAQRGKRSATPDSEHVSSKRARLDDEEEEPPQSPLQTSETADLPTSPRRSPPARVVVSSPARERSPSPVPSPVRSPVASPARRRSASLPPSPVHQDHSKLYY